MLAYEHRFQYALKREGVSLATQIEVVEELARELSEEQTDQLVGMMRLMEATTPAVRRALARWSFSRVVSDEVIRNMLYGPS